MLRGSTAILEASIKSFIHHVSGARVLVTTAMIPIVIYEVGLMVMNTYMNLLSELIPLGGAAEPIIENIYTFTHNLVILLTSVGAAASISSTPFTVAMYLRSLEHDLRSIRLLTLSRLGMIFYVILILILASLYGFILGSGVSALIVSVTLRILSSLGLAPYYSLDVVGAIEGALQLLPILITASALASIWVIRGVNP